ncbi:MAG TPA: DUF2085 domain-containing protein [Anaerolineales bacterium]|nr:DUF2085 domain-containing protein [Anaerolineae bacterium]HIQ01131.1 DUF2085 domain-containing protein [Anaerolineales bacterium]
MTDETRPEPTVEEIVAEVERRTVRPEPARELSPAERRLVITANRAIFWLLRHWLAFFNLGAFLYVGLPFLAPLLMRAGMEGMAQIVYALYRPLCHQLPYRSWYLFGSQLTYTVEELARLVGPEALVQHGYIGDVTLGFKVALCQRDTAIYGSILLAGLAYGGVRRRVRPLPLWVYLLFGVLPIGLDGGLQVLSYALPLLIPSLAISPLESTPLRRVVTGVLFGLMTVWLAYPNFEEAASDVLAMLERRFGWER